MSTPMNAERTRLQIVRCVDGSASHPVAGHRSAVAMDLAQLFRGNGTCISGVKSGPGDRRRAVRGAVEKR
ncbi:MAG TPA: hypothetical protein VEB21_05835, partial [Terriglobales bacterium]|nr:hypothetical protein [Terriglobales bacterium]